MQVLRQRQPKILYFEKAEKECLPWFNLLGESYALRCQEQCFQTLGALTLDAGSNAFAG